MLARTFPITARFAIVNTLLLAFFSLLVALALNRNNFLTRSLRILYYIPVTMSGIVIAFLFRQIFAAVYNVETMQMGALNALLHIVGLGSFARNWLSDPDFAMICIIVVSLWQSFGFFTLIYLANLQNIPKDYYEAADIDGANLWQKFRYITWPQLAPSLTIVLTLLIIGSLKTFELFLAMTEGGPMGLTKVLSLAIYVAAFQDNRVGLASAYSVVLTVVIAIITISINIYLRKREDRIS